MALSRGSAKTFEDRHLDTILSSIDPLLTDPDRFKQRAGAEVLVGLLRGITLHMFSFVHAEPPPRIEALAQAKMG